MERALVVTDPNEAAVDLVHEAGSLASGVDASLVVLTVVTEDEYDTDAEILSTIGSVEGASYDLSPVDYAAEVAETATDDILSAVDVETDPIGAYVEDDGDRAEKILEVAEREGVDTIFLLGRRRSPTGKAIFGNTAQSVILNFDGRVVVEMA